MRKIYLLTLVLLMKVGATYSQSILGKEADSRIKGAIEVFYQPGYEFPSAVKLSERTTVTGLGFNAWLAKALHLDGAHAFVLIKSDRDNLGFTHHTFQYQYNGFPITGAVYKVHEKNGRIQSFNGLVTKVSPSITVSGISEKAALTKALKNIGAQKYKWESAGSEKMLKSLRKDATATFYPTGKLEFYTDGKSPAVLAYHFDVYASEPIQRYDIYVDASTGEVLKKINKIHANCFKHSCHHTAHHVHSKEIKGKNAALVNATGTAQTRYSGVQSITTDFTGSTYRLRETGRGDGVETYNIQSSEDPQNAIDITDADNNWTADEAAYDAHWGAEATYDYYFNTYGRNGFDGDGGKMISYVHFGLNEDNAYWDGFSMLYGDGNTIFKPLTALDVVGHEFTHGLTEHSANLVYEGESGALNESFSDMFGTAIEYYKKPGTANYLLGEQIMLTDPALRSLSAPNDFGQPDTYQGDMWDAINEEVHTNSGVGNFWFYLLCEGGTGTNDNSFAYNLAGIGMIKAANIAFRTLTVYLTPNSNYDDTRLASIMAATDLYGACSAEVQAVANTWRAVGVGNGYTTGIVADFYVDVTKYCDLPASVSFINNTLNGATYEWDFGDGNTSTQKNPVHEYLSNGIYTITMDVDGGACGGTESVTKTSYIEVDNNDICTTLIPDGEVGVTQTKCNGILKDSGEDGNYPDMSEGSITISPSGATSVILQFSSFDYEEDWDYLNIYDGPNTSSPIINSYTGSSLPNGGTVSSTGGSITLEHLSDEALNFSGFVCTWQCVVSVNDASVSNLALSVFPNPTSDVLNLNVAFSGSKTFSVTVHNALGVAVYTEEGTFFDGYKKSISVKDFPAGLYTVQIRDGVTPGTFTKVVVE